MKYPHVVKKVHVQKKYYTKEPNFMLFVWNQVKVLSAIIFTNVARHELAKF